MKTIQILFPVCALATAWVGRAATPPLAPDTPDDNVVTLAPATQGHVTLATQTVAPGSLDVTLKVAGRISFNLNRTARITPTFDGRLTELRCDLNARVAKGDVLACVESPELLGRILELKAPLAGVVAERHATVGEAIARGSAVYTVTDPTELWAIAEVQERDIAAVQPGQETSFTVLAYPDETFHGKVALIGNQVEAGSRTIEVRIEVDNHAGRLKPGMFADIELVTTILRDALVIPDTALQTDGDSRIVFVALDAGRFQKRTVQVGREQAGRVQITAGLRAGETVVTTGSFILKSELLKGQLKED